MDKKVFIHSRGLAMPDTVVSMDNNRIHNQIKATLTEAAPTRFSCNFRLR